jgi:hypothetical protein
MSGEMSGMVEVGHPNVFAGAGVTIELMPGTHMLRMTRNDRPFESVNAMIGVLDEFQAQLRLVDRASFALLVDTRKVAGRTDPGFERAFRHFREHVISGFARVAILVASAEGLAQAEAHAAEHGPHVRAFDNDDAATEWLREVAAGPALPNDPG